MAFDFCFAAIMIWKNQTEEAYLKEQKDEVGTDPNCCNYGRSPGAIRHSDEPTTVGGSPDNIIRPLFIWFWLIFYVGTVLADTLFQVPNLLRYRSRAFYGIYALHTPTTLHFCSQLLRRGSNPWRPLHFPKLAWSVVSPPWWVHRPWIWHHWKWGWLKRKWESEYIEEERDETGLFFFSLGIFILTDCSYVGFFGFLKIIVLKTESNWPVGSVEIRSLTDLVQCLDRLHRQTDAKW